jgi:hypothetical protein
MVICTHPPASTHHRCSLSVLCHCVAVVTVWGVCLLATKKHKARGGAAADPFRKPEGRQCTILRRRLVVASCSTPARDLNSEARLYPVQWLELVLAHISSCAEASTWVPGSTGTWYSGSGPKLKLGRPCSREPAKSTVAGLPVVCEASRSGTVQSAAESVLQSWLKSLNCHTYRHTYGIAQSIFFLPSTVLSALPHFKFHCTQH